MGLYSAPTQHNTTQDRTEWDGMGREGPEWKGMGRGRMEWEEKERRRMGPDGMGWEGNG